MKHRIALGIGLVISFILLSSNKMSAQYTSYPDLRMEHSQLFFPNMDTDFYLMRQNACPDFHFGGDSYLRLVPAATMVLMKAFGYESRSSWGRMVVSDAFSVGCLLAGVEGLKYSVQRMRPDGSERTSFPSGHTASAFSFATMMHLEYGWRSPWFSIGAYTLATSTALLRVMNNRHWMSDTFAGALIGIGATHLGYYITDRIFGDRYLSAGYAHPEFFYDSHDRQWEIDLQFYRRFVFGEDIWKKQGLLPERGSGISLNVQYPLYIAQPGLGSFPLDYQVGVLMRTGMGSLVNHNVYNILAGGYGRTTLNDRFQIDAHLATGYAFLTAGKTSDWDVLAGLAFSWSFSRNFKLKGFAEYEYIDHFREEPALHSALLGLSAGFYW